MASLAVHAGNFRIEDAQRLTQEYGIPVKGDGLEWLESAAAAERRLVEEDPESKECDAGNSNPYAMDEKQHKGYRVHSFIVFPYTSLALPLLESMFRYYIWLFTAGWSCCILRDKRRRSNSKGDKSTSYNVSEMQSAAWEEEVLAEGGSSWWELSKEEPIGSSRWYFAFSEPGNESCLGDLLQTCTQCSLRNKSHFPCRPINASLFSSKPEPQPREGVDYLYCRQCRNSRRYSDCFKHCCVSCGIISLVMCAYATLLPFFALHLAYGITVELIMYPVIFFVRFCLTCILLEGCLFGYASCCGKLQRGCRLVSRVLARTGPTGRETQGLSPDWKLHPLVDIHIVENASILRTIWHRIKSTYSQTPATDFISFNPAWALFEPGIPLEEIARGWEEAIRSCKGEGPTLTETNDS
eukprot:gb/GECG01006635.1/.p1 GENE.gb/GECG01006635.1/~~gb/GECG01006635.1/.p1  ORF type:complete len:411 (+),score=29.97 gb/GECG01006635.1/:1-1233(+)